MSPNPSRREVLAAAPLAAVGVVFPPGISWPPHQRVGWCPCKACATKRVEQHVHPLRRAVAVSYWRARAAVALLTDGHGRFCRVDDCEICDAAGWADWFLCLAGGLLTDGLSPDAGTPEGEEEAKCQAAIKAARSGSLPRCRHARHPAHEPAAVALDELARTLRALLTGHGCPDNCLVCTDAYGVLGGVERSEGSLVGCLPPS